MDNRRAKALRLAEVLFDWSISHERASTAMLESHWATVSYVDDVNCKRKPEWKAPHDDTKRLTLERLRELELADFRVRLKAMRRFCRNEQKRLLAAKGEK